MQLENGWIVGVTRVVSPHCDRRPDDEPLAAGHPQHQPAARRIRRPLYRPAVYRHARSRAAPYFAEIHQLRVSAHCLIRRDGEIVQYVPFDQRARHAGVSLYQGRDRCNDFSIGIELEGTDLLPYTEAQYRTLQAVTALLAEHYPPLVANIAGHCDIAPAARPIPGRRSIGIAIWHLWNNATRPPTLCLRQEKGEESLMTLFTLLLVLARERLFKLGEHWQLDHRLEVVFQRLHRVSLAQTLAMTAARMVIVWGVLWLSHGLFFGVVTLLLWIVIDLLCVGAGIKRKHYRAYLKAARQGDTHASDQMAEELALIHGLPVDCSEELRLRELQNALLWINFRYYRAAVLVRGLWALRADRVGGVCLPARLSNWLARHNTPLERSQSGIDHLLNWLDWIPVRLAGVAYALFGHGERALPARFASLGIGIRRRIRC